MAINSVSSTTAIVPFLLKEDNYEDWRIYIENYLLAQDLWGIIESGEDADLLSSSNDVGNWRKKNAAALHAIHTTSSSNIVAQIKEIKSAKDAWNKLAQMHQEWQSKLEPEICEEGSDGGEEDEAEMTHSEGSGRGEEDKMFEDFQCIRLRKSICSGNWIAVRGFFNNHPLDTRIVSDGGYTALHVAIQTGQDKIAEELIKMMSEADLELKNASSSAGHTALSLVAWTGRTHVAKCIVRKNRRLLTMENYLGNIPVVSACSVGHKEMTEYLFTVTPSEVFFGENGNHGFRLMRWSIANKMLDICLNLLWQNPEFFTVATNKNMQGESPILTLSRQPSAFFSGCRLQFWQKWIYHWLKVQSPIISYRGVRLSVAGDQDLEENIGIQVFDRLRRLGLMLLNFSGIKQIYDLKLTHVCALEILHRMCDHVSRLKVKPLINYGVVDAIFEATKQGVVEFAIELLKVTHPLIYTNKEDGRDIFTVALQYRQGNIFNLLYSIHEAWKAQILNQTDEKGNTILHVAGEIAPDFQLARISNTALQMQRELQWFKEIEQIVPEWCKEAKNHNHETPYEVFSKSHKDLVKEGAKWMKDTASSFIIVGTLIVTIVFAAAFTHPGGNDQSTGFPMFLRKRSFMIFIISDATSFFAASTSVLMFLGILTSRFAQEDFLESLPRKLIFGLSTLFISIAAMMVSFSAALLIILQDRWWAIIPIIMMASIPVMLFVWLQFPLLLKIFVSTYAPGIFNRKMKPWL